MIAGVEDLMDMDILDEVVEYHSDRLSQRDVLAAMFLIDMWSGCLTC